MDILQRLGGRKFIISLIVIGVAVFLDMKATNGLTTTMAGFLVSMVGMFSVANSMISTRYMQAKGQPGASPQQDRNLHAKVDALSEMTQAAFNPEAVQSLTTLLTNLQENMSQIKDVSMQTAQAVVNHTKVIQGLQRRNLE